MYNHHIILFLLVLITTMYAEDINIYINIDRNIHGQDIVKTDKLDKQDMKIRILENSLKFEGKNNNNLIAENKVEYEERIPENKVEYKERIPENKVMEYEDRILNKIEFEEMTGEDDHHPCNRKCEEGKPKICYYHFKIEWYRTMSRACFDCPHNKTDCERMDCVPADGVPRGINVINRKMPGPAIEVCLHDKIVVDVENSLDSESTTIHWHGIHQQGTPFMDGVPHVTQCPIEPRSTFRYQFFAYNAGTHFWHSHIGTQRADGATGVLIVRDPLDRFKQFYDYDSSEHVIIVMDWLHELTRGKFMHHLHNIVDNKPPALLVNGIGRFSIFNDTDEPVYMKAARLNVKKDYSYRFRLINAEFLDCPIEISIDGHNITVIASDGHEIEPVVATSLVTYAGERYDFIITANNTIGNYWIRFRGHIDCDARFNKAKQVAILHYEGAEDSEPAGDPTWEEMHNTGLQINAVNKGEEDVDTISVAELRSIDPSILTTLPDYKFYIAYDFYAKNNPLVHRNNHYGFSQVANPRKRIYTPQFNHISMKLPPTPFLIERPSEENFCNSSNINETCKTDYCSCSHVISVKRNSIVELVIVDEGAVLDANHPIHLHGHSFRVLGMRKLGNKTTVEEVKSLDEKGNLKRNLDKAPLKDTVTVPDGGYTIVRFVSRNPGYWLLHCHIEFHVMVGMALIFKVGEHNEMTPIPPNFPSCGNYMPA